MASQIFPTSDKRKNILDAARRAVAKDRPDVVPGFEAHHVGEKFATIWDEFAAKNPQLVKPSMVRVNAKGKYPKFIDPTVSKEFRKYHASKVEWKVLSHEEHLAIHQAEDAARNAANSARISKEYQTWAKSQNPKNIVPFDPTPGIARSVDSSIMDYADYMSESLDKFIRYDLVSSEAVAWTTKYAASEIKAINSTTKDTIRNITRMGLQEGLSPAEQSKLIKQQIGLLPNHVIAVNNYKKQLESTGMNATAVDKSVQKYTDKLLKYRADTIGLTESHTAANNGQRLVNEGLVKEGIIQKGEYNNLWITSADERRCPICGGLSGQIAEIGSAFPGGVECPPAHIRCRCTMALTKAKGAAKYSIPSAADSEDYIGMPIGNAVTAEQKAAANVDLAEVIRKEESKMAELSKKERETLFNYTAGTNRDINSYLNGHVSLEDVQQHVLQSIQKDVDNMDKIFKKTKISSDMKVYRGINPNLHTATADLTKALKTEGSVLQMDGFISTSVNPDIATRYAKEGARILEIQLPKNTPAAYLEGISKFKDEEEMLLNRGMTFIVGPTRVETVLAEGGIAREAEITTLRAVLPQYTVAGPMSTFAENQNFVSALKEAGAVEWRKIFTEKYPDIFIDLNEMDPDLQLQSYLSLNNVLKGIKNPKDILEKVTTATSDDGFFVYTPKAYAAAFKKEIQLNLDYYGNKELILKSIAKDIEVGFHPVGFSPEWVVTHEVGHTVMANLQKVNAALADSIEGIINKAKESGDLDKWGQYAGSDGDEAFAEIYAAIHHTTTGQQPWFVKAIKDALIKATIPGTPASTVKKGLIQPLVDTSSYTGSITVQQMEQMSASIYPNMYFDINGMDPALAKELINTADAMMDRSKFVKAGDNLINTFYMPTPENYKKMLPNNPTAYAVSTTIDGKNVIIFNPSYFTSKTYLDERIAEDAAAGYHPKGSTSMQIPVHEIGHAVNSYLKKNYPEDSLRILEIMKKAMADGSLAKFSAYAASDPEEAFAEIYSAIYTKQNAALPNFVNDINKILAGG